MRPHPTLPWIIAAAALVLVASGGCNRTYYRRQADVDAERLIAEKNFHPHWYLPRTNIDIDPRSRMFDPFNPDFEPIPLDDPYSHELMHWVDDKKGWRRWHQFGDTDAAQNPEWWKYLPLDDQGVLLLNAERAYQLALLHSRDYQEQFETLYLSALDVSAERFRFDTQFFGGYGVTYETTGRLREPRSRLTAFTTTDQFGRAGLPTGLAAPSDAEVLFRRAFATGGELAVGIANALTWDFAGPNNYSSLTILDFSLIQPLLRLAGRERVLEQLTLSERQLLANVRQMERYRQAFYTEILTGRNAPDGATRRGGLFGGAGLEGFTGVGGGGFGRVGGGGGGGTGGGTQLTTPSAGGFLGLLQAQENIRIQQANIAGLRTNLAQLRESLRESLTKIPDDPESVVRERLQIAQARQAMLNSETRLLAAQADYQRQLDVFKITMGLPPSVCVSLDDRRLEQFNLIDPVLTPLQNEITAVREEIGLINEQLMRLAVPVERDGQRRLTLEWNAEVERHLRQLRVRVARINGLRTQLESSQIARARTDLDLLRQKIPSRTTELERLGVKYLEQREMWPDYGGLDPCQVKLSADIEASVFDTERLAALPGILERDIVQVTERLGSLNLPINSIDALLEELIESPVKPSAEDLYRQLESQVIFGVPNLLTQLSSSALDLSLIQARARVDAVELTPIDMGWDFAVELARRYRHDWMNARASLVDTYRLIFFNADALQSSLDVTFAGDLRNVSDNPFDLGSRAGRLRVGLEWDGPFTRLRERNTYRQALIEFQQARRSYYAFEDAVSASLRDTIRIIDLNQLNFEERRIAVLSAIEQVVLNDEIQRYGEERGLATGATAARDAVSALTDLQEAQNLFLGIWVNYEALRIILDLDLGTMQLDGEGNWIDPGAIGPAYGLRLPPWDHEGIELLFEPTLKTPTAPDSRSMESIPPGNRNDSPPGDSRIHRQELAPPPVHTGEVDVVPARFTSDASSVLRRLPDPAEEGAGPRASRANAIPTVWPLPSTAPGQELRRPIVPAGDLTTPLTPMTR
jgi:hypothetical protein